MTDQEALIDQALDALGGENTEFYLTVTEGRVALTCRYQDCGWGETVGEMELWEFVTDARQHWDARHAAPGDPASRTEPPFGACPDCGGVGSPHASACDPD